MMHQTIELIPLDPRGAPAARCAVCGSGVPADGGLIARYGDRTLRFRCPTCLERFRGDPDRYLAGHPEDCCRHEDHQGGVSEWTCD